MFPNEGVTNLSNYSIDAHKFTLRNRFILNYKKKNMGLDQKPHLLLQSRNENEIHVCYLVSY